MVALFVWIVLTIPTILWWRDSVFWVSIMSLYAILATHWGGYNASRAKEEADDDET